MLAISADDADTLRSFKKELQARFPFIPDPDSRLIKLYDIKMPVVGMAARHTFVVGEGRKVLKVQSGSEAIDPAGAIAACPLRRPDAGTVKP